MKMEAAERRVLLGKSKAGDVRRILQGTMEVLQCAWNLSSRPGYSSRRAALRKMVTIKMTVEQIKKAYLQNGLGF